LNAGLAEVLATQPHALQLFKPTLPGQLFRHTDGGIYRFLSCARHAEDQAPLVIYEHVWPFDPGATWARPAREWPSRFTPITARELGLAMREDQEVAQQAVINAKAARRAAEASRLASELLSCLDLPAWPWPKSPVSAWLWPKSPSDAFSNPAE
jgi:hypothetical protein